MAARGLVSIDKLSLEDEIEVQQEGYLPSGGDIDEGYLAGVIFGDGWESCDRIGISFNDIETSESSRICNYINSKFGTSLTIRRYKQRSGNYVLRLMTGQNKFYEFGSNSKNLYWCISHPKEWVRGFISGWFFADGHIESGNSNSIAITNSNREYLEVLATSLLQFGISTSNIYFVKRAGHESDEIYDINGNNGSYRLTLTGEDKIKFATEFPLRGTIKDCLNIVRPTLSRKPKEFQKVISIKFIGEEKVYDFTTDGEKLFFANGIKTLDCGEQPLGDYESCNLGSINLGTFATDPECEVCDQGFDIGSFLWTIDHCVRYLDAIIDIDHYPLEQIKLETQARRKIGLGVMGWADTLIQLNIPWCSQQALDLIDHIGEALHNQTRATSEQLAQEFSPFPMYDGRLCNYPPRRNATLTTIAPTGTLSKLAKCSSGIEPIYDWEYDIFTEQGTYHYSYPLRSDPCVNDIAHMIPYDWHIKHQAQWQKWIDNAVSKTINLPAEATVEDVRNAFILAWELGCKGITIYRDGSKDEQVLTSRSIKPGFIRRPGAIYEVKSGCGTLRVVLGATDDSYTELYEGYAITAGGCTANNEAIGRSISLEMQEHIPVEKITGTLHKVRCINAMRNPQSAGRSCADIIATCIDIETKEFVHKEPTRKTLDSCPSCKAPLQHIEGCGTGTCLVCGWSGCS
jgi:ribonucleoside-diphosphate reductase alpha chain